MDIIRNSVWLSQGTDLLAEGLYPDESPNDFGKNH